MLIKILLHLEPGATLLEGRFWRVTVGAYSLTYDYLMSHETDEDTHL
jgi:hypothetical protein